MIIEIAKKYRKQILTVDMYYYGTQRIKMSFLGAGGGEGGLLLLFMRRRYLAVLVLFKKTSA